MDVLDWIEELLGHNPDEETALKEAHLLRQKFAECPQAQICTD